MKNDPSLDPKMWERVIESALSKGSSAILACEICGSKEELEYYATPVSRLAKAVTNKELLCRTCAIGLGYTVLIEEDYA